MSLCVEVYLVELAQIDSIVGSNSPSLLETSASLRSEFWDDDEDEMSLAEAATAVVRGGPFDPTQAASYAYALRALVDETPNARFLDNDAFCPAHSDYLFNAATAFDALDLRGGGLFDLIWGVLPQPLPAPDDLPNYGTWTNAACCELVMQWAQIDVAKLPKQYRAATVQAIGWAQAAAASPGYGVVAFTS